MPENYSTVLEDDSDIPSKIPTAFAEQQLAIARALKNPHGNRFEDGDDDEDEEDAITVKQRDELPERPAPPPRSFSLEDLIMDGEGYEIQVEGEDFTLDLRVFQFTETDDSVAMFIPSKHLSFKPRFSKTYKLTYKGVSRKVLYLGGMIKFTKSPFTLLSFITPPENEQENQE